MADLADASSRLSVRSTAKAPPLNALTDIANAAMEGEVAAGRVPPPLATGWGRWTESHRRDIYGPVGDARGYRHLPASSLDPGRMGYTSGVHPTPPPF